MKIFFTFSLFLLQLTNNLFAQADCNDLGREISIAPGIHNSLSTNCPVITIDLVFATISTQSPCIIGYSEQKDPLMHCAGSSPGTHCLGAGFKAVRIEASGGGCPSFSPGDVGDWQDWRDIPESFMDLISCTPPMLTEDFDWSAKIYSCATQTGDTSSNYFSDSADYVVHQGPLPGTYPQSEATSPFLNEYDLAQSEVTFAGILESVSQNHSTIPSARISAKVRRQFFDSSNNSLLHSQKSAVTGIISADGTFNINKTSSIQKFDESHLFVAKTYFDGDAVIEFYSESDFGNVVPRDSSRFDSFFASSAWAVEPFFWWLTDPFYLPNFTDQTFLEESVGSSEDLVAIRRVIPGSDPDSDIISSSLIVDTSASSYHPVSKESYNGSGDIANKMTWQNYQQITPDSSRPMSGSITQYFYDYYVVTEYQILEAEAVVSTPSTTITAGQRIWFIWE